MSSQFECSPLPRVYGNELEASVQLIHQCPSSVDDLLEEPTLIRKSKYPDDIFDFIPKEIATGYEYLKNGFRMYDGSYQKEDVAQIEIATPECATVEQAVVATRVSEKILQNGLEQFISRLRQEEPDYDLLEARIQKRVVDSTGTAWGCHDNYGFDETTHDKVLPKLDEYLTEFLNTRSFIVGAGWINRDCQYRFAQKIDATTQINGYGFFGRHYRDAANSKEVIKRIEIGSSDANISDWATRIRIGSTALLFAVLATDHEEKLDKYSSGDTWDEDVIRNGKVLNHVGFDGESIHLDREQWLGIDYQQKLAEIYLQCIAKNVDDSSLMHIAQQIYSYCEDMKAVARREKPISLLSDRADWAAKLIIIQERINRANKEMSTRKIGDIDSRADDLRYDHFGIIPKDGKGFFYEKGFGFRLRERGHFKDTVAEHKIKQMYLTPPETRAAARGKILSEGHTIYTIGWEYVTIKFEDAHRSFFMYDASKNAITFKPESEENSNEL